MSEMNPYFKSNQIEYKYLDDDKNKEWKLFRQCVNCGKNRFDDHKWDHINNHTLAGMSRFFCNNKGCSNAWKKYAEVLLKL